ncbi:MAG: IPT/TIG domain-containing protein, partial [Polyangiaceae bacterium]
MGTWRSALGTSALAALAAAAACLPGSGPAINPVFDDAGTPPPTSLGDDAATRDDLDLGAPFAVTGLQPSHGPWTGGTRTSIAGRGFSSKLQVWIGSSQLPASDVFASDPTKAAVITPPGAPGPVEVRVENMDTAQVATLPAGFIYDAFSVTPGTGSTTGGTRIALKGSGTTWSAGSTVAVGGKPCTAVTFTDATDLACSTPANAAGSQSVLVTNPDGTTDQADDAFVYSDSPDGYRGGLYGGALSGTLTVLGFDQWTGVPLEGGQAIAGSNLATAVVGTLGAAGAVQLTGAALTGKVTVTLAAKCHQPMTYVDVPVDTATFYLPPALDPSCQGDPPSSGNYIPQDYGSVQGELVWPGGIEFQRAAWSSVPAPGPGERQAAYVFTASGTPLAAFGLPDPHNATTPTSGGQVGYAFSLETLPGNRTLYALAGLEQDYDDGGAIGRFEPFVMGVARGVPVLPNEGTAGIDIPMTTLLDRSLQVLPQPPAVKPGGPDRLVSTVLIDLGSGSYAPLPQGSTLTLLPVAGAVSFVGVPALDSSLVGAQYDVSATAVTGLVESYPVSAVTGVET